MSISTMGFFDQPDRRASKYARSMYASVGAMMMPAVWCSARVLPGRQSKSGSSERATFMRNVPEPQRHWPMRSLNSLGSASGAISFRYRSLGFRFETTALARNVSPASVTAPTARPPSTMTSRTGLPTWMSTPRDAADFAMACVIAPIPPIAWPQTPFLPLTSPKT